MVVMDFVMRLKNLKLLKDADVMDELKTLIIKQYKQYVCRLRKGYRDDYSTIMNKINFLDVCKFLDRNSFIY